MSERQRQPGSDRTSPSRQGSAQRAGAPGKRPHTASLSTRRGAVRGNIASAPVQAKPAAPPADTASWTATAMRPDLYPAPVQRAGAGRVPVGPLPSDGGGKAMPAEVQTKMEGAFGADFSSVRVHEGPRSEALGARAYTQGTDIHFAPGEYQPSSPGGQELLGHELAHVVQQSRGQVQATTQAKGVGVNDDPGLEREADELGARAARGERVSDEPSPTAQASSAVQRSACVQMRRIALDEDALAEEDGGPGNVDIDLLDDTMSDECGVDVAYASHVGDAEGHIYTNTVGTDPPGMIVFSFSLDEGGLDEGGLDFEIDSGFAADPADVSREVTTRDGERLEFDLAERQRQGMWADNAQNRALEGIYGAGTPANSADMIKWHRAVTVARAALATAAAKAAAASAAGDGIKAQIRTDRRFKHILRHHFGFAKLKNMTVDRIRAAMDRISTVLTQTQAGLGEGAVIHGQKDSAIEEGYASPGPDYLRRMNDEYDELAETVNAQRGPNIRTAELKLVQAEINRRAKEEGEDIEVHVGYKLAAESNELQLARLLIHEFTHKCSATADHGYATDGGYAGLTLDEKIDNADSYAFAAISIYLNSIVGPDSLATPDIDEVIDNIDFPLTG